VVKEASLPPVKAFSPCFGSPLSPPSALQQQPLGSFEGHLDGQPTQEAGGHKIFQIAAPAGYRLNCSGETCVAPVFLYTELKSFSALPIDTLNMLVHTYS
jgi:hypothetical protein